MSVGTSGGQRARLRRPNLAILALSVLAAALVPISAATAGTATASVGATSSSHTVWLCRPGLANDPCLYNRSSTAVSAKGAKTVTLVRSSTKTRSRYDCFYVYPTVSPQTSNNADLTIQPIEQVTAVLQASRFSQVCNVWAPMYRQATGAALRNGSFFKPKVIRTAYDSLASAWTDYLRHDNHGHPVVFIGHSQGAAMLIKLLRQKVDPSAQLRHLMVSAIILGGNVQVKTGSDVGGSFQQIPTCGSATQTHCVIAYSTFPSEPPTNSLFGRPGRGVSLQSGQTPSTSQGEQVACVNPTTFSSAPGSLLPFFSSAGRRDTVKVVTPWVSYPQLYTAQCMSNGGATWLQVTSDPGDPRPTIVASMGPTWGYHQSDVNVALGDLVFDVAAEEAAYQH
jgi:hypothetical protein